MKSISEIKNILKGIISKINDTKEQISELEDRNGNHPS